MFLKRLKIRPIVVIMGGIILAGLATPAKDGLAADGAPEMELLAQFHAPLRPPQVVGADLLIFELDTSRPGSFVGPKISGKPIGPCADWLEITSDGNFWLDVRCTIQTDDGALIYVEYSGVIDWNEQLAEKCNGGGEFAGSDMYFYTHPKFRTIAENYAWLNNIQAIGEMTAVKCGEGSYVKYDIYQLK